MGALIVLFAALAGVAAVLASIAIWSPRRLWLRATAVAATALVLPLAYLSLSELLSRPKPLAHAWTESGTAEATLLGASLQEGRAIYLWLRLEGSPEPRAYALPWDTALAQRLQDLIEEAIAKEGVVRLRNPFAHRSLQDAGRLNPRVVVPSAPPQKPPPLPARVVDPREQRI